MLEAIVAENAELKARLGQNSSNSSRPPSSDPPSAPPRPAREASGKRRGGQPGHKKHERTLLPPERVSEVHELKPRRCRRCGDRLCGHDPEPYRHQVIDIPKVVAMAVEYRLHSLRCERCSITTQAELPAGVPTTLLGPRLQAVVAVSAGAFRLSKRLIEEMLANFFDARVCLGTVANTEQRVSEALAGPVEQVANAVRRAAVVHADETGWRIGMKKAWLWLATTSTLALFLIRRGRGTLEAKELLGAGFGGTVVSDRWRSYRWVASNCRQLCWSHLKRDFKSFEDYDAHEQRVGAELLIARRKIFVLLKRFKAGLIDHLAFRKRVRPLQRRIEALLEEGSGCRSMKVSGICREILRTREALWTFVERTDVPPTNNHAERVLRHAVIWRKASLGTDSEPGSRFVERVLTAVQTLRLQGRNVLEYMTAVCQASLQGVAPPSLLPVSQPQMGHRLAA